VYVVGTSSLVRFCCCKASTEQCHVTSLTSRSACVLNLTAGSRRKCVCDCDVIAHRYGLASNILAVSELFDSLAQDFFQQNPIARSNHSVLPEEKTSSLALRPRGHQFQLPIRVYRLFKCSFVNHCLFKVCLVQLCFMHLRVFYVLKLTNLLSMIVAQYIKRAYIYCVVSLPPGSLNFMTLCWS